MIILHFQNETLFCSKFITFITWRQYFVAANCGRILKTIQRPSCYGIVQIFVGVDAWYTATIEFYSILSQNALECPHCPHICRRKGTWAQTFNPYHTDEATFDAILVRQRSATEYYARQFLTKQSVTFEPRLLLLDQSVLNEAIQEKMRRSFGPPW